MILMRRTIASLTLPALLWAGAALAQNSSFSAADKKFVTQATEVSNAEIQLGNLAQQKSSSDDVKQFGQKMVTDHTNLNQQMQPFAQQMGLTIGQDQVAPKDKAEKAKLEALSGKSFDDAYLKAMVAGHRETLAKFKQEIATTQNPDLKSAVQQGEQVVAEHLRMAEQLAQAHHLSTGNAGASSGR